jgi:hypothetical protein
MKSRFDPFDSFCWTPFAGLLLLDSFGCFKLDSKNNQHRETTNANTDKILMINYTIPPTYNASLTGVLGA